MPPRVPPSTARDTLTGSIGVYRVRSAAEVHAHLRNLRAQLPVAAPGRRIRILADIDLLLDRLSKLTEAR